MSQGRITTAKVGEYTYEIPEMWIAGFCQANNCHTEDAIAWWDYQEGLERAWQAQQQAAA